MSYFKCKMCGGTIEFVTGDLIGTCDSCGSIQTLPKGNDDVITNLFNRANNLRIKAEFDKAAEIYEKILNEDNNNAEAHWGVLLCKYGIEYVEDPATYKRVPTCHRARYESVLADADYIAAIENCDTTQQTIYTQQALEISNIQKGILSIVKEEEPFDVFICYKETDESGKRTVDSALANDIYYQLTQEGLKVFYAAITLEDKLGQEYEPYIFAALNSAKVMLVVGTKPEYFDSVWVRNEWSRYLKIMASDRSKLLIPCYRDMDAYDLPEEFAHLQAQDMSKIGFVNDVVRGIKKVIGGTNQATEVTKEAPKVENNYAANVTSLLKRVFVFLEDGKWTEANEYCEKVLDLDVECAEAYLGKLMAELQVKSKDNLKNAAQPFDSSDNYTKACRYGSSLAEKLKADNEFIRERNETARKQEIYDNALSAMNSAKIEEDFKSAASTFESIKGFKDADEKAEECIEKAKESVYLSATFAMNSAKVENDFKSASEIFNSISGYKDADEKAEECLEKAEETRKNTIYDSAISKMLRDTTFNYKSAISQFESIIDWKDSREKINECNEGLEKLRIAAEKAEAERKRKAEEARIAAEKTKAKTKKIIAIVTPIVAVAVAFLIILNTVIIPRNNLKKALALLDAGNYDEAYSMLAELGENETINESIYARATEYQNVKNYESALSLYSQINGYKDTEEQIIECKKEILKNAKVGDTVIFGNYEQDNNTSNGKEEIEWIVLAKEGNKVLIISKYALDCQQYNTSYTDVTWENCTLRKWMNNEFLNAAFNSGEQALIATTKVTADANPSYSTNAGNDTNDKVFLLSINEVNKYFSSDDDRMCVPTDYAKSNGAYTSSSYSKGGEATCWWWLRSPGYFSNLAAFVSYDGAVNFYGYYVSSSDDCVRPALWIEI